MLLKHILVENGEGHDVPMSAEEEADIRAEWAKNDEAARARPAPAEGEDSIAKLAAFLNANPDVRALLEH